MSVITATFPVNDNEEISMSAAVGSLSLLQLMDNTQWREYATGKKLTVGELKELVDAVASEKWEDEDFVPIEIREGSSLVRISAHDAWHLLISELSRLLPTKAKIEFE